MRGKPVIPLPYHLKLEIGGFVHGGLRWLISIP
jgi:hypothetical protein